MERSYNMCKRLLTRPHFRHRMAFIRRSSMNLFKSAVLSATSLLFISSLSQSATPPNSYSAQAVPLVFKAGGSMVKTYNFADLKKLVAPTVVEFVEPHAKAKK